MSDISFFVPIGPFNINELSKDFSAYKNKILIKDLKTLDKANKNHISFLNSPDYIDLAKKTKASVCITTFNLKQYLPKTCLTIVVKNVLLSIAEVSKKFYPDADIDYPEQTLIETNKRQVQFQKNLGLSAGEALKLSTELGKAADLSGNIATNTIAAAKALGGLNKE